MIYDYAVLGAGPAGIIAVVALLKEGVPLQKILWLDDHFQVGAFGSEFVNVPGNTEVEGYLCVYEQMSLVIQEKLQINIESEPWKIRNFPPTFACSLKDAAVPLRAMTEALLKKIPNKQGIVTTVNTLENKIKISLQNISTPFFAQKVIFATGIKPKTLEASMGYEEKIIPWDTCMDYHGLKDYVNKYPLALQDVHVIGSSHTAALVVMNMVLLAKETGQTFRITQHFKHPYLFAEKMLDENNKPVTKNDNTGLKGQVAIFMKEKGEYSNLHETFHEITEGELLQATSLVVAIGIEMKNTFTINDHNLSQLIYNLTNSETNFPNIYAVGAANAPMKKDISGAVARNVGVTKFWPDILNEVKMRWI